MTGENAESQRAYLGAVRRPSYALPDNDNPSRWLQLLWF